MTPRNCLRAPVVAQISRIQQVILQLHTGATRAETLHGQDFSIRSLQRMRPVTLWNQKAQR